MTGTLLDGKTAVVTGGAQGIGQGIAREFLNHGANVVVADINTERLNSLGQEMSAGGNRLALVHCDVGDESDMEQLVRNAVQRFGRLDVMVNNAGIVRDATMRKMDLKDFQKVTRLNLESTWLGTRAASLVMRDQQSGSIINMSSISGKVGFIGQTNYSAAKSGIIGLTKAAAKELGIRGVRVNCLLPGYIKTPLTEDLNPDIARQKVQEVPLGRPGEIHEVANAAVFLASDLASYISGISLEVAGGRHI